MLLPIPLAVFRLLKTAKRNPASKIDIAIIAVALLFSLTFVAHFNVLRIIHFHRQQSSTEYTFRWSVWSTGNKLGEVQEISGRNSGNKLGEVQEISGRNSSIL